LDGCWEGQLQEVEAKVADYTQLVYAYLEPDFLSYSPCMYILDLNMIAYRNYPQANCIALCSVHVPQLKKLLPFLFIFNIIFYKYIK
jgi:hypothetical protein